MSDSELTVLSPDSVEIIAPAGGVYNLTSPVGSGDQDIVVLMDGLGGGSSGPVSVLQQTAVAGVAISALKCVRVFNGTASVVSSNTVGDAGSIVGVTTVAGNAGNTITIQTSGPLTDASFSFVEGQIWCGGDGSLTQTPPVSGFNQVIGTSEGAHTIQIGIQQPYLI